MKKHSRVLQTKELQKILKYSTFILLFSSISLFAQNIQKKNVQKDDQEIVGQPESDTSLNARFKKAPGEISGMNDSVAISGFDERVYADSRKADIIKLVDKAVAYLEKNDYGKALNAFTYSPEFRIGEVHLFVYDYNHVCLAHGEDWDLIWQDRTKYEDALGQPVVKNIIEKAKSGGGWLNYEKDNATKVVYVKSTEKSGKRLVIGAGFYPLSKRDSVVSLVRNAVDSFNKNKTAGRPNQAIFGEFSYPLGRFVIGDLYLFALDFKGFIVAQGDIQGIIGTNALNNKDESGKFINREIIDGLKEKDKIWVEYVSKGAKKLTYAEQVTDNDGNKYFIACGYYPETNRKTVVDLVKKGFAYMTKNGITASSKAFSARDEKEFRYGDLFLFVYDYNGRCVAHGANRDYIGINQYNVKDEGGKYPIRMFIDKAKAGGGWINYKQRNSYMFTYVEEVTVGGIKYAIGCGIFPTSKPETMQLMVKDASGMIRDDGPEKAFEQIVQKGGKFVKGDLQIFVFDFSGLCYTYGPNYTKIWKNMLDEKDDDGRPYVKLIINTAKDGSGTVLYKENGRLKTAYVMKVDRNGQSFAVGSSFFLK